MKAFLLSIAFLVGITLGVVVMLDMLSEPSSEAYSVDESTRL